MIMKKRTKFLIALTFSILLILTFFIYQIITLQIVHSTFENYYNFRGCTELINKTDDYGFCKINSGQIIKIVKYENRWFLDGDLPSGFPSW